MGKGGEIRNPPSLSAEYIVFFHVFFGPMHDQALVQSMLNSFLIDMCHLNRSQTPWTAIPIASTVQYIELPSPILTPIEYAILSLS